MVLIRQLKNKCLHKSKLFQIKKKKLSYRYFSTNNIRKSQVDIISNEEDFGLPDLNPVEIAKSLLEFRKSCYLHTVDIGNKDYPTLSRQVPYVLMNDLYPAMPILPIEKDTEQHDQILNGETVSIEIYPFVPSNYDPIKIDLPKLGIIGTPMSIKKINELEQIITQFRNIHDGYKIRDEEDIYLINPENIFYFSLDVTQFKIKDIIKSPVDPIMIQSEELLKNINQKFGEELKLMCKLYGDIQVSRAFVFSIDRRGFDMVGYMIGTNEWRRFRVPFDEEILNIQDYKKKINELMLEVNVINLDRK